MTSINPSILPEVAYQVLPDPTDIKTDLPIKWIKSFCDQSKKISLIAWDILSIIILPIGIVRIAGKVIAPMIILPAMRKFGLEWRIERLKTLEENLTKQKEKFERELATPNHKLNASIDKLTKEIKELNQSISEINKIHEERDELIRNNKELEQITVKTSDGIDIDTVKIKNEKSDKWIIYFCPNAVCYELILDELKNISEKTGANVYTGNYRGVMRSKGRIQSSNDMVLDGKAMVQKLLSEGVPQDNILIQGWSIGGAVATAVASHYPKAHHCNESSFGSLKELLNAHVPVIGSALAGIAYITGWRFNSASNFQKVEGKKLVIYSKSDGVIPYKSTLFKMLKNINIEFKSIETKARKDRADYINSWKEMHPDIKPEKAKTLAKKDYVREFGVGIHCKPLSASEDVFARYVEFVKDALKLQ